MNIDARAEDGKTALYLAASKGNLEAARLLTSHGANLHIPAKDGKTAAEIANATSYPKVGKFLESQVSPLTAVHACPN